MSDSPEAAVFILEKRCDEKGMRVSNFDKMLITIIIGIVFFILAMPFIFKLTNKGTRLFGISTITNIGSPTTTGLILHTIIFIIVVRLLMH